MCFSLFSLYRCAALDGHPLTGLSENTLNPSFKNNKDDTVKEVDV